MSSAEPRIELIERWFPAEPGTAQVWLHLEVFDDSLEFCIGDPDGAKTRFKSYRRKPELPPSDWDTQKKHLITKKAPELAAVINAGLALTQRMLPERGMTRAHDALLKFLEELGRMHSTMQDVVMYDHIHKLMDLAYKRDLFNDLATLDLMALLYAAAHGRVPLLAILPLLTLRVMQAAPNTDT